MYNGKFLISTDPDEIKMFVYSRQNPKQPLRLLFNETISKKLDASKVTKILIHGFSAGMYFAHRFINGKRLKAIIEAGAGFKVGILAS